MTEASTASRPSRTEFSWWLLLMPATAGAATLLFVVINFVWIADEKRIFRDGIETEAEIVRIWEASGKDAKGRDKTNRYVHLRWLAIDGSEHQFEELSIGRETYAQLKGEHDAGSTVTRIRYDVSGEIQTPALLADLPNREHNWAIAWWGMWAFALLTAGLAWLVRWSYVKAHKSITT